MRDSLQQAGGHQFANSCRHVPVPICKQFGFYRNWLWESWRDLLPIENHEYSWDKVNNSYFCDTNQDGETIHFIGWIIEQNDWMKKIVCCLIWPDTNTEKSRNKIEQEEEAGNSNASL